MDIILIKNIQKHWEIISKLDLLSGSGFHLIHPDIYRVTLDPPLNALTGSDLDQIQL